MPAPVDSQVLGGVKPSPSLLHNNLCPLGPGLAYAHTRNALTVRELPSASGACVQTSQVETRQPQAIQSAACCSVKGKPLLVLGYGSGLQVWDPIDMLLLFVWNQPSSAPPATDHLDYVKGIAFTASADGGAELCAGCSSGEIQVFTVGDGPSFRESHTLRHHAAPVLALGSAFQSRRGSCCEDLGCQLVSSDDNGCLAVWEAGGASGLYAVARQAMVASPCCSIAVRKDMAICGCMDGSIRIFQLGTLRCMTEVKAHSRWLCAMDIHPTKDLLASASEDASVAVWQLPPQPDGQVRNVLSTCCYNAQLTGVAFCGDRSQHLAAVAYDSDELHVWRAVAA